MRGFLSLPATLLRIILFTAMAGAACTSSVLESSVELTGQRPAEGRNFRARLRLELKPALDEIDPLQDLRLWRSAPKEWATQRVARIESIRPRADSSYIDPQNGNLIYY